MERRLPSECRFGPRCRLAVMKHRRQQEVGPVDLQVPVPGLVGEIVGRPGLSGSRRGSGRRRARPGRSRRERSAQQVDLLAERQDRVLQREALAVGDRARQAVGADGRRSAATSGLAEAEPPAGDGPGAPDRDPHVFQPLEAAGGLVRVAAADEAEPAVRPPMAPNWRSGTLNQVVTARCPRAGGAARPSCSEQPAAGHRHPGSAARGRTRRCSRGSGD